MAMALQRAPSLGSTSRGPQFQRPLEYDPERAAASISASAAAASGAHTAAVYAAQNGHHHRSQEDKLRDDFGLDAEGDGGSDDERGGRRGGRRGGGGGGGGGAGAAVGHDGGGGEFEGDDGGGDAQAAFEQMQAELNAANHARYDAEAKAKKAEDRIESIERMSKSAKAVLVKTYGEQMRVLQNKIDEQKDQIAEDDSALEAMRKTIAVLEHATSPDPSRMAELPRMLREMKDSRELQRQLTDAKYREQELMVAGRHLQDELTVATRERDELKKTAAAVTAAAPTAPGASAQLAEVERAKYHAQIQKLRETVAECHVRLSSTLTAAPAPAPAPALLGAGAPAPAPAPSPARPLPALASPTPAPAPTPLGAGEDVSKYTARIRALEEKLAHAEGRVSSAQVAVEEARSQAAAATAAARSAAAAASSSSSSPGPVAAPTPAPTAVSPTTSAEDKAKIESLEEMVRNADTLLKRREEEIKLIKAKAQEKLNQASAAIKKLKSDIVTVKAEVAERDAAIERFKLEAGAGIHQTEERAVFAEQTATELKTALRGLVGSMAEPIARRRHTLLRLRTAAAETRGAAVALRTEVAGMGALIPEMGPLIARALKSFQDKNQGAYAELSKNFAKEQKIRKDLFNQIQELKGNIRVYCRIRPPNSKERAEPLNVDVITFPSEDELKVVNVEKKTTHVFDFERIFRPGSTQESVFADVVGLVQSVMDGFNVCIFAYGQTGSGKTYTMEGPREDPGVNLRALNSLFQITEERKTTMVYEIHVTMLEVYNEQILDLLGSHDTPLRAVQGEYGMEVKDLSMRPVTSLEQVLKTLREGQGSRTVVKTDMNEHSSRSHLITSCYIRGRDVLSGKEQLGKLHLIDLAGSERVGRSGVTGSALKEAQSINSSLSALGDVIAARAARATHIPYRNSVLTHLLQDSLEKNSKTLMFVQCSPAHADSSETICALKFAHRVRQVELGKAGKVEKAPGKKAAAKKA